MGKYSARIYTGDYSSRQAAANVDGCVCYAEQHFNSSEHAFATGSFCVVSNNASLISKKWAKLYSIKVVSAFPDITTLSGPNNEGIWVGGYQGKGNGNLSRTRMPAILCEPLFLTNSAHQKVITSTEGQDILARILIKSIKEVFPKGGLVGLSIGHIGKESSPRDKGAYVSGIGYEGEFAKEVILKVANLLEGN